MCLSCTRLQCRWAVYPLEFHARSEIGVALEVRSYGSHRLCFIAPFWGPLRIKNGTRDDKIETFFTMRSETLYITSGPHDALL